MNPRGLADASPLRCVPLAPLPPHSEIRAGEREGGVAARGPEGTSASRGVGGHSLLTHTNAGNQSKRLADRL